MRSPTLPLAVATLTGAAILAGCDSEVPPPAPPPTLTDTPSGPPAVVAPQAPPIPTEFVTAWEHYLQQPNAEADGWTPGIGNLPAAHRDALRRNLIDERGVIHWAAATDDAGQTIRTVLLFNTSGEALKVVDLSPTVERQDAMVTFDTDATAFYAMAQRLAVGLLDRALTRQSVAVAQLDAYAVEHEGIAPDLSAGWDPLTAGENPRLTEAPVNPINGQSAVGSAAGPQVGWVQDPGAGLRLSIPRSWRESFPALTDRVAVFY